MVSVVCTRLRGLKKYFNAVDSHAHLDVSSYYITRTSSYYVLSIMYDNVGHATSAPAAAVVGLVGV